MQWFGYPTCVEVDCELIVDVAAGDGVDEFALVRTLRLDRDESRVWRQVLRDADRVRRLLKDGRGFVHDLDRHHDLTATRHLT